MGALRSGNDRACPRPKNAKNDDETCVRRHSGVSRPMLIFGPVGGNRSSLTRSEERRNQGPGHSERAAGWPANHQYPPRPIAETPPGFPRKLDSTVILQRCC